MNAFMNILDFLIRAAAYTMIGIFFCILPFLLSCLMWFIIYYIKGKRLPKVQAPPIKIKNQNILVRLFILFPQRYILDMFERDPDAFPLHGLHVFAGEQGAGKTLAMVHFAYMLKNRYPNLKIKSNFHVEFSDDKIHDIDDIIFTNNGSYGEVQMIDEIQTWFNSLESKNFPLEMIQEICQQRKQRKIILGTSQVFNRVAKAIREQTYYIYEPMTIFGCLTIVRVYKPKLDTTGSVMSRKRVKMYFFIHSEYLRNSYDTYEKIERLNSKGFKPLTEQINNDSTPVINYINPTPINPITKVKK